MGKIINFDSLEKNDSETYCPEKNEEMSEKELWDSCGFPVSYEVYKLCEDSRGRSEIANAFHINNGKYDRNYPTYAEMTDLLERNGWIAQLIDETDCNSVKINDVESDHPELTYYDRAEGLVIRQAEPGKFKFGIFFDFAPIWSYDFDDDIELETEVKCDSVTYEELKEIVSRAVRFKYFIHFAPDCDFAADYDIFSELKRAKKELAEFGKKPESKDAQEDIAKVTDFLEECDALNHIGKPPRV